MPTTALPLDDLAQRISRQQSELETLRAEYEARKHQMTELQRRKQELASQLRQVDAEIQAVARGNKHPQIQRPKPVMAATSLTLADFIVTLIHETGQPMTVKQLAAEAKRRKFPTKSKNIPGLVQTRVMEMVKKGILSRAKDQPGYIPSKANHDQKSPSRKPVKRRKKISRVQAKSLPSPSNGQRKQRPLREVVTDVLQKSKQPLSGSELAEQVLASGYHSKSADFPSVVWAITAKMKNIENVPGEGYRLKKR